jgi:hypothetical protein
VSLSALIRQENDASRMWAALVEHQDGQFELHDWEGQALVLSSSEVAEPMRDWLLTERPIACGEAKASGLELLSGCKGCDSL